MIVHCLATETGDSLVGFLWFRVQNGDSDLIDEPDYRTLEINGSVYQLRYREGM